MSGKLNNMYTT